MGEPRGGLRIRLLILFSLLVAGGGLFHLAAARAQPVATLVTGATPDDSLAALGALAGTTVRSVRFLGNESLSNAELGQNVYTEESSKRPFGRLETLLPREFARDRRRLEIHYQRRGFPGTRVRARAFTIAGDAHVEFKIDEGRPLIVAAIEITGWPLVSPSATEVRTDLPLERGQRLDLEKLDASQARLVSVLADGGYWKATVTAAQAITDSARIVFDVQSGARYYLRDVVIEPVGERGLADTPQWLVLDETELEPGTIYRPKSVEEARRKIQQLAVFQQIEVRADSVAVDSVDVSIGLGARAKRSFAVGGGYSSEEHLRLRLSWLNRSFLGGARRLTIDANYSSLLLGGRIGVLQPRFLRSPFDLEATLQQQLETENNYDLRSFGGRLRGLRHVGQHLDFAIGVEISRNDLTVKVEGSDTPEEGPSRLTEWQTALLHDSTDLPLAPTLGNKIAVNLRGATSALNSDYSYGFAELFATRYRTLGAKRILALQVRTGFGLPAGETATLPVWARQYGGGAVGMRSYARRTLGPLDAEGYGIGGEAVVELTAELRLPIGGRIFGAVFGEVGQVWEKWRDIGTISMAPGIGAGLRLGTPIGPLRFDIGWKLGNYSSLLDPYALHFAVGEAF